jgi:hypothetical protein
MLNGNRDINMAHIPMLSGHWHMIMGYGSMIWDIGIRLYGTDIYVRRI